MKYVRTNLLRGDQGAVRMLSLVHSELHPFNSCVSLSTACQLTSDVLVVLETQLKRITHLSLIINDGSEHTAPVEQQPEE